MDLSVPTQQLTKSVGSTYRQSEMLENTIELESLRGTVRGLENWIGSWKRERELFEKQRENQSHRRWGQKQRKVLQGDGADKDAFIDGVSAWMRGWRDVEEGFRIRAQMRNQRREIVQSRTRDMAGGQGNAGRQGGG